MNKIWGLLAGIQVSNMVVIECVTSDVTGLHLPVFVYIVYMFISAYVLWWNSGSSSRRISRSWCSIARSV
jgi:hypothetical protein